MRTYFLWILVVLVNPHAFGLRPMDAESSELPGVQEIRKHTVDSVWTPMTAVYLEFGGKFLPSLNVDFRRRENLAFALGAAYWYDEEGGGSESLFLPSLSAYYLGGKRHQVELGGGLGPFISTRVGLSSILLFANVGYRYQKRNGLILRAGFTPWMTAVTIAKETRFAAVPWAGVSVGYSF